MNEYLNREHPEIVQYYVPITFFNIGDESFSKTNLVTRQIIKNYLYQMRTDIDLKILFKLFGGRFFPQNQEIYDGTGGLYFTEKDFKGDRDGFKAKISILSNHLYRNNFKTPCIALNKEHHWVAIQEVKKKEEIIVINNPLGFRSHIQLNKNIPESYRFYLFDHNQDNAFILINDVVNFLNREIKRERKEV
ncbi:MAG: hypothetical protein GF353_10120 [Candidatus Lokiarchaeota archaeon]|nr:hypothetical protein [Candidatus Lokiarchaeota archaeon]